MNLFYCYSNRMKDFFTERGFSYVKTEIHYKTGKRFWCYLRGDLLEELLAEYKQK